MKLNKEIALIILNQISTTFLRLAFAFLIIPYYQRGEEVLMVFVISELLSVFMTCGRNYLIQAGFNHHLISKNFDKIFLIGVSFLAYFVFSSEDQRKYIYSIVILTICICIMTMYNATFLRDRKYYFIIPLNFSVYLIAVFCLNANFFMVVFSILLWFLAEYTIPESKKHSSHRLLPALATILAFISQRVDVQIAALLKDTALLADVFQLNTLFMPMAIIVRIVSTTALLRGLSILNLTSGSQLFMAAFGLIYGVALYVTANIINNELIKNTIILLTLSTILAAVMMPYREMISIQAREGNLYPIFNLSLIGVIPSLFFIAALFFFDVDYINSSVFVFCLYVVPRLLMYGYGFLKIRLHE